ncbi:PAS domain-containing protein [Hymenobacter gummosus]|uniref:histidine kinase n=1 Tax=Hymenobacter gummosus TaxID=1776032 RepID=A0A431U6Y1_9BACT|nr:PAS domain-containing protein [Hymenobacter gummosus]RTQ52438.1 PAS domain-containing protein [Hymenobacter gummosus]
MPDFPASPTFAAAPPDELLRTLLNVSLTGVILFRPRYAAGAEADIIDLTYEHLNPAAQRMLNLPERPAASFLTLYPHAAAEGVFGFYCEAFRAGGQPRRLDVNYQRDGLDNYFHLAAQRSGELLVVSFTDTADHERSAAEQALRESQAREREAHAEAELQRQQLRSVFEQAPAMICIFQGPEHVFQFVNPPYQALVGERHLLGLPIAQAMPELHGQPIFGLLDRVYQTGETFYANEMLVQLDHQNEGRRAPGELDKRYYNFIYQARRSLSGRIDGIFVFAYDVTPQVQARQLVQELNEELAATNEELRAANEEFLLNNAQLLSTQLELRQLTQALEERVGLRTSEMQAARAEAEQQRARLERLFMQAPAGICILGGDELVFELVNPAYEQLFPGRRLLGQPILDAIPEISDHAVHHTLQRVYDSGVTHQELSMLLPVVNPRTGKLEERYFNYIQQARYDEHGWIDGVVVFAFEVTEQVRAQQASEAAAQRLRLLTDALPVLISYVDQQQRYQFANQAYQIWFHKPPEALLNRPVREVIGEQAYQNVRGYLERGLAGEALDFESRMPYREGFVKHIRTSYIPDWREGQVAGLYALVTDVTEQTLAQQHVAEANEQLRIRNDDLAALNQQLRRTNADLDNFIYTASHDLKAPITNIEGLLRALTEQLPPEALAQELVQPILERMHGAVDRFKRTIDYLTDVSKLQQEYAQPTEAVVLAAVVEDVRQDLLPLLREAEARLTVDVAACPTISFSPKNLRSIVYNLLSNALKYRHPERLPQISISCHAEAGRLRLLVEDNGLGFDDTQQGRIFGMFQRLHTHVEGSGIGLYMVKKIVENAGGRITVLSHLGEGSTFTVELPL